MHVGASDHVYQHVKSMLASADVFPFDSNILKVYLLSDNIRKQRGGKFVGDMTV